MKRDPRDWGKVAYQVFSSKRSGWVEGFPAAGDGRQRALEAARQLAGKTGERHYVMDCITGHCFYPENR